MRRTFAVALFALAACGQGPEKAADAAPAPPAGLAEQAAAMSDIDASVMAWSILSAKEGLVPPCETQRSVADQGVVPADVDPASIYAPYVGARVFAIQCGPLLTTVRARAIDHWLVVLAPGAAEAQVINCADEGGRIDRCAAGVTTVAPAPAPAQ